MDFCVARAMQILTLNEGQLHQIHERENIISHCLPNWEIQDLIKTESVKDYYGIPEDAEALRVHSDKVLKLLDDKKMRFIERQLVTGSDLELVHSFDWGIFKRRGEFDFSYVSKTGRSRRLKDLVEAEQ